MNTILNGSQSGTNPGGSEYPAGANLTGKENLIWKITNNNGVANFVLVAAVTDQAVFVGAAGDIQGNTVRAEAPNLKENCRVIVDTTNAINPGDLLSLSPNTFGQLYKPVSGAGAGRYTFQAEEAAAAGASGQLLLVRRIPDQTFSL